jgi:MFS transporter, PAT family, beta-lactamase induction signal transducer AmpG
LTERAASKRRALVFFALYAAEGAPIGFLWYAMPPLLRESGVAGAEIATLTSTLALPWAFKFVWAPCVDAWRGPRFGRREWIVCAQLLSGLALLPMCFVEAGASWIALAPLLIVHAVAAATQDVAIDATAIEVAPPSERGSLNGAMQAGMLVGRGVVAGGAARVAEDFGSNAVPALLALFAGAAAIFTRASLPRTEARTDAPKPARLTEVFRTFGAALRSRDVLFGLAFAVLAGFGFEAVGGTATLALYDLSLEKTEIGDFMALPWALATCVGALLGGVLVDRLPRRTTCAVGVGLVGVAILASFASYAIVASKPAVLISLCGVGLTLGVLTSASYALFMDLSAGPAAATLCGAFMGATNACESLAVRFAGFVAYAGRPDGPPRFATAWLLAAGVSLFALPALAFLRGGGFRARFPRC